MKRRPPPSQAPEATEEWFICTFCMSTGLVMFALFVLLPFISNIICEFDSTVLCLVSVTPLCSCTHLPHAMPFFSVMFLGDAYAWATPSTLAAPSFGDTSSWRRLLSWRRVCLAAPVATSNGKRIKTETKTKVFLELFFLIFLFG